MHHLKNINKFNIDNYQQYSLDDVEKIQENGVYCIYNKTQNIFYLGYSNANMSNRLKDHFLKLKYNYHNNHKLQIDWNKKNKFIIVIIEISNDRIYLAQKEQYYLKFWNELTYNKTLHHTELPNWDQKQLETFWSKINKKNHNKCWIWTGEKDKNGYGRIRYNKKSYRIHRLIYCYYNQKTAKDICGLIIRHICDNPICCNPKHLLIGTDYDNSQDRLQRKRYQKSRFTEQDIKQMILLRQNGKTYKEISKILNIPKTSIYNVLSGLIKSTQSILIKYNHQK